MIFLGIDVAKDKHDYFIINSAGEVLFNDLPSPTTLINLMSRIRILCLLLLICPI